MNIHNAIMRAIGDVLANNCQVSTVYVSSQTYADLGDLDRPGVKYTNYMGYPLIVSDAFHPFWVESSPTQSPMAWQNRYTESDPTSIVEIDSASWGFNKASANGDCIVGRGGKAYRRVLLEGGVELFVLLESEIGVIGKCSEYSGA